MWLMALAGLLCWWLQTFVRAHDMTHALNLEKAGATAVVPEILEPSLQLAAAALQQLEWNSEEVREAPLHGARSLTVTDCAGMVWRLPY